MRSFEYYTPTRVIFGKDKHLMAGSILKEYGCRESPDPLWKPQCGCLRSY